MKNFRLLVLLFILIDGNFTIPDSPLVRLATRNNYLNAGYQTVSQIFTPASQTIKTTYTATMPIPDTNGCQLLVAFAPGARGATGSIFRDSNKPVIVWNSSPFDDFRMVPEEEGKCGITENQTEIILHFAIYQTTINT